VPSKISTILQTAIRGFRPLLNNLSLEMERAGQDLLARNEIKKLPPNMVVVPMMMDEIPVEWFHTIGGSEQSALIYFHGGAYMVGSLVSNRVLAVDFAQATGCNTLSFEYRLAPEHPFPAALEDAMNVYRHVLELGIQPEHIAFVGDSAGGGLELGAALKARDEGLPLPKAIVAISPWVDLTLSGESYQTKKNLDPLLTHAKLARAVGYYAPGCDLHNPYISPLYGDFTGFPPTLIHVGTHEVLLSEAQQLSANMRRDGVSVTLDEWEGMWHVWHVFDVPETRKAMEQIAAYILDHIR